MKRYIIALDEGTTSTRAVLYDLKKKKIERIASRPLEQFYPESGYVEENAAEIYAETLSALAETIESVADTNEIAGIGVTNQRKPWSCGTRKRDGRFITPLSGNAAARRNTAKRSRPNIPKRSIKKRGLFRTLIFPLPR